MLRWVLVGLVAADGCRREPTSTPEAGTTTTGARPTPSVIPVEPAAPVRATFTQTPGRLAVGDGHSCVLSAAGEAWCWGSNSHGQLGDGREVGSRVPVRVPALRDLVAIAADMWSTCALGRAGEVWCWGAEQQGTKEVRRFIARRSPVRIPGLPPARTIGVGPGFACAATTSEVWCWGDAPRGVHERNWDPPTATPVRIPNTTGADELCAGRDFACARKGTETRCWGPNYFDSFWLPVEPGQVEGLAPAVTLTCRNASVCVAGVDGHVTCVHPQYANFIYRREDVLANSGKLEDITGVVALTTIGPDMCGVFKDGRVACWRDGWYGYEEAAPPPLFKPRVQAGITAPRAIAGAGHGCALGQDGAVRCWGGNGSGETGGGMDSLALVPERIAGADGLSGLVAGSGYTCGLRDRKLWCWGYLESFPGVDKPEQPSPVALTTIGEVRELAIHDDDLCWRDDISVTCRVTDGYPQRTQLVARPIAAGARQMVTRDCVLDTRGIVDCGDKRVYDGRSFQDGEPAQKPYRATDMLEVAQGSGIWCGRRKSGAVSCAKIDQTVLRAGDVIDAVTRRSLRDVIDLDKRGPELCVVRRGGQVACGTTDTRFNLAVRELPDIRDATALRSSHAQCILRTDRTVACWGANHSGQLGDGTTAERTTPTPVPGLVDVRELTMGPVHTCARTGDGSVWCWGEHLGGPRLAIALTNSEVNPPRPVAGLPPL